MIGALVFLGCPLRMVIRMAAGDLNAYMGLIGFVLGVGTGCIFLKKGFSLGRSFDTKKENGYIIPAIFLSLLVLSIATPLFAASTEGPGSLHAPILVSLAAGLIFGAAAQKARACFAGGIRDVILMKNFLEYPWHLYRRLCSRISRRLSSAPADSGRPGVFGCRC